jgi:hypothetical protein
MRWAIAILLAPVLFWAALSPSSAREGNTSSVGGPGGAEFHASCAPGEAVIGFYYTAGKDLDEIAALCQPLQGNRAEGPYHQLLAYGGLSLSVEGTVTCSSIMVVQAIHVTVSAVNVIHDFWLTCRSLVTDLRYETKRSRTKGGEGGNAYEANCGDDGYAVGLWGRAGSLVDAVGLACADYPPKTVSPPPPPPPPDKPPPPPPPKPKPDKPPLKVFDSDDQDQNADTGDNGGASAAQDTTIYDQPDGNDVDYLSAGDPVTIVSCNGDNWCRISRPRQGWVWGGDLNR